MNTVLKPKLSSLCFLLFSFSVFADPAEDGMEAFKRKNYSKAKDDFQKAQTLEPHTKEHVYNKGVADYWNQDYDAAMQSFSDASQSEDKTLAAKGLYNLGTTKVSKGDLEGAVEAYDKALQLDPQDQNTKENKDWVQKKIAEMKKQQQDQNKDQKDQKDQKDDKKDNKPGEGKSGEKGTDPPDDGKNKKDEDKKNDEKKQESGEQKKDEDKKDEEKKQESGEQKKDEMKKDEEKKQASGEQKKDEEKKDQKEKSGGESTDPSDKQQGSAQKDFKKDPKAMSKEDAERLLRSIEDQEEVYGVPFKAEKPKDLPTNDW